MPARGAESPRGKPLGSQRREVGQLALGHPALGKLRIHAVEADDDHATRCVGRQAASTEQPYRESERVRHQRENREQQCPEEDEERADEGEARTWPDVGRCRGGVSANHRRNGYDERAYVSLHRSLAVIPSQPFVTSHRLRACDSLNADVMQTEAEPGGMHDVKSMSAPERPFSLWERGVELQRAR